MAQPTTQLNATEQDTLVKQIGLALLRAAPRDWRRVTAHYRAVGRYHELTGEVVLEDGSAQEWMATHDIATLFGRLRGGMYREGRGTWFNARYQLDHPSSYNLEYDRDEPRWDLMPPPQAYADELRMFPRSEDNVPEWLMRRMAGLAPEQPGPRFRIARIFDGHEPNGRPVLNRPELGADEQQRVLEYLNNAPVVRAERGFDLDRLAQQPTPAVPVAFHTDGVWIWPAAINYYLQEYGVAPEAELVSHIAGTGYALPEVPEQTMQAAAAYLGRGTQQPPRQAPPAEPAFEARPEPAPAVDQPTTLTPAVNADAGPPTMLVPPAVPGEPRNGREAAPSVPSVPAGGPEPESAVEETRTWDAREAFADEPPGGPDDREWNEPETGGAPAAPGARGAEDARGWEDAESHGAATHAGPEGHGGEPRGWTGPEGHDTEGAAWAGPEAHGQEPPGFVDDEPTAAWNDRTDDRTERGPDPAGPRGVADPAAQGWEPETRGTAEPDVQGQEGIPGQHRPEAQGDAAGPEQFAEGRGQHDFAGQAGAAGLAAGGQEQFVPETPDAGRDPRHQERAEGSEGRGAEPFHPEGHGGPQGPNPRVQPAFGQEAPGERVPDRAEFAQNGVAPGEADPRVQDHAPGQAPGLAPRAPDGPGQQALDPRHHERPEAPAGTGPERFGQEGPQARDPRGLAAPDAPEFRGPRGFAGPEGQEPRGGWESPGSGFAGQEAPPEPPHLRSPERGAPAEPRGGFAGPDPRAVAGQQRSGRPAPEGPPTVLARPVAPPSGPTEPALDNLRRKLSDLGVPEGAYRIGAPAEHGWSLEKIDDGWRVGWYDETLTSPAVFGDADDAAAFMLGKLLLGQGGRPTPPARPEMDVNEIPRTPAQEPVEPQRHDLPPRALSDRLGEPDPAGPPTMLAAPVAPPPPAPPRREPPARRVEAAVPAAAASASSGSNQQWPIQPLPGEPPLTLFRGKEMRELPAGSELDRFGGPNGNLTYAAGTPFAERSLVPEWVNRPYHLYRVQRPLEALAGIAIPWFNQPGGGAAYLLPASIEDLLASGDLIELDPGEPPID